MKNLKEQLNEVRNTVSLSLRTQDATIVIDALRAIGNEEFSEKWGTPDDRKLLLDVAERIDNMCGRLAM